MNDFIKTLESKITEEENKVFYKDVELIVDTIDNNEITHMFLNNSKYGIRHINIFKFKKTDYVYILRDTKTQDKQFDVTTDEIKSTKTTKVVRKYSAYIFFNSPNCKKYMKQRFNLQYDILYINEDEYICVLKF